MDMRMSKYDDKISESEAESLAKAKLILMEEIQTKEQEKIYCYIKDMHRLN